MTAKMDAAEALGLATGLVSSWRTGDSRAVVATLAKLDEPDLRIVALSALRVVAALLDAEARATNGDEDAPAAVAFWVASQAVPEAAREAAAGGTE